jgi:hypothetical protein
MGCVQYLCIVFAYKFGVDRSSALYPNFITSFRWELSSTVQYTLNLVSKYQFVHTIKQFLIAKLHFIQVFTQTTNSIDTKGGLDLSPYSQCTVLVTHMLQAESN